MRHIGSGKVRDLFELPGDRLVLAASDRISAYDVVLPTEIPDKGVVLTALSHHFLEATAHICPSHLVSVHSEDLSDPQLEGRAMVCRKAEPIPIEFVVRGYLSGSGFKEYVHSQGICGHLLPGGLVESDRLPEPLLTPATKATDGHDENITEPEAAAVVGEDVYEEARAYALAVYSEGARLADERGVIIADTKFEFGLIEGRVTLIDEVLTPDSSRFWPQESYAPGGPQPSFDKQFVRDWLDRVGWDHSPPAPELPSDVVSATRSRYVEAYERLTGKTLESWMKEVRG
ncbi:MAG: phosphoribosylaminoimidazolesuccinocarboxamide synthase [Actinomycetota bacterium]|nr:phosphoribosylaminoimidazolesuccinocarboxamide synthase [Actinomycetota bacterium]